MKTLAVSIDELVLERVDRLARVGGLKARGRSQIIREAIHEYVSRVEHQAEENREAAIVRRHRTRLAHQARVLVRELAKP